MNSNLNPQRTSFLFTLLFVVTFLGSSLFLPEGFRLALSQGTAFTLEYFGGFYLVLGLGAVLVMVITALSPIGKIRLGVGPPEYSLLSWIAMLYSTGMGAGLLLRAVQEPVYYFANPPRSTYLEPADFALQYTFFHWGLTPWAFYGLFGLIMATRLYNHKGNLLVSNLLPSGLKKPALAAIVDFLVTVGTLLGVVAAVGLGSRQLLISVSTWAGMEHLADNGGYLLVVMVGILATISAILGVKTGIRLLSNANIGMATILLLMTWLMGSEIGVIGTFFWVLGGYLWEFIPMSLNWGEAKVSEGFLTDWTYFYWAFWLAWAPFTGIFIARISKGRTIRQFVAGTLVIPAMGTFLWFTVFGSNAFALIDNETLYASELSSIYNALFRLFHVFPLGWLGNGISLILIFTFLITSVDSAIFVLSMFSDHGKLEPQKRYRLFWGISIVLVTLAVMLIGKDQLLESVSQLLILIAFPVSLLFLGFVSCWLYGLLYNRNM
ncbi:BCCT family transporter [Lunatibacter salilacus]|uniref:BCCT family transporter n=1 Tax=Lunatibacter salilacus TaxID=2483804 RepID=UPI00131E2E64|nr:BCCT family transporter [Lunatibacter salilacus]